jgi:hypothetical protein
MAKRQKPVARCILCGNVAYHANLINETHKCLGGKHGVWDPFAEAQHPI